MPPGSAGRKITAQLLQALPGLHHTVLQAPDIRLASGNVGSQGGFPAPQLQELLCQPLGVGSHGGELLLQFLQLPALAVKGGFDFFDSALGLGDLGRNAAAAVLLALQFFLNSGNIIVVVLHIAPEHRHLAVQLLVGAGEHVDF